MNSYLDNYRYLSQVNKNPGTSKSIGNLPSLHRNLSYFGRVGYSFSDRYNLQFILRADAFDTSKLDKDHRWGKFPSVSAGWTIHTIARRCHGCFLAIDLLLPTDWRSGFTPCASLGLHYTHGYALQPSSIVSIVDAPVSSMLSLQLPCTSFSPSYVRFV